jgi:hypothetical protein
VSGTGGVVVAGTSEPSNAAAADSAIAREPVEPVEPVEPAPESALSLDDECLPAPEPPVVPEPLAPPAEPDDGEAPARNWANACAPP